MKRCRATFRAHQIFIGLSSRFIRSIDLWLEIDSTLIFLSNILWVGIEAFKIIIDKNITTISEILVMLTSKIKSISPFCIQTFIALILFGSNSRI